MAWWQCWRLQLNHSFRTKVPVVGSDVVNLIVQVCQLFFNVLMNPL